MKDKESFFGTRHAFCFVRHRGGSRLCTLVAYNNSMHTLNCCKQRMDKSISIFPRQVLYLFIDPWGIRGLVRLSGNHRTINWLWVPCQSWRLVYLRYTRSVLIWGALVSGSRHSIPLLCCADDLVWKDARTELPISGSWSLNTHSADTRHHVGIERLTYPSVYYADPLQYFAFYLKIWTIYLKIPVGFWMLYYVFSLPAVIYLFIYGD